MKKDKKVEISFLKKKLHYFLTKLESKISKWRKHFIVDPEIHFFISQPLRQADRFLKKLYLNDDFYRSARYAWVEANEAKKLYLYGCARQVVKASMLLLENEEHILEQPKKGTIDTMGRAILESITDAQNLIIRRHIELLVNLLNFTKFNKNEFYRIFLNVENLEHFLGRQADFKDFYESKSENIQHSINDFTQRIEDDLKTLNLSELWFLKNGWETQTRNFNLPLMKSVRQRYMAALPSATDDEKIMLGFSYNELFSDVSVSAHASAGSRIQSRHYKFSSIRGNMTVISLLGQHIVNRLNELMGFDDSEDVVRKMQQQGTSDAPKLLQRNRKVFQQGDIVLATGDLAEIIESKTSKYGYASCKVRFLTRPPLPEVPEDWLPSAFVISILPKARVRDFMFENKNYSNLPKEVREVLEIMRKEPDDKIITYARGALVSMHQHGVLIPALLQSGYLKERDLDEED